MSVTTRRFAAPSRVACVLLMALLSSCATVPSAGIDKADKLPADGGIVAVQVVTNSEKLSDALPNWSEVLVVDQDRIDTDGKPLIFSLPALNDGLSTTRAFVGILSPGHYRFAGLYAFAQAGSTSYYQSAPAPRTVGSFEIQTGHLTNLGTVLFQPFLGDPLAHSLKGQDRRFAYAMSRLDDSVSLQDFVSRRYPAQFARTQGQSELGWLPDALTPSREKLAAVIRAHAVLSEPHFDPSTHEIFYTARLGTLYRRDASAHWSAAHMPTHYAIVAFASLPDGRLVTGGERGGIWSADRFDGTWQPYPLDDREQTVVWLGVLGGDRLCAIAASSGRYRLYQTALSTPLKWQLVQEYGKHDPEADNWRVFARERAPAVAHDATGLRLFDAHASYRYDAANPALVAEANIGTTRLVEQPNGITVAMPYSGWSGTKPPQVSRDHGAHWEAFHRLGQFQEPPYVFADGTELGIDSDSTFVFVGWKKNENIDVFVSADKGVTHSVVGQVPYGCSQMEPAISTDELLFSRCFDGTLLTSADRGRTWSRESDRSVRPDTLPTQFLGGSPEGKGGK